MSATATLWPVSIELAGAELELADVLSDVTIRHGRADVFDNADASSAQLTLLGATRELTKTFRVGVALSILAAVDVPEPRFYGWITDARLDDDRLTVVAAGRLSTLWRYTIGDVDWPAELWSARVTRAFTEAGLGGALVLEPAPFDPLLAARPAAPLTLATYLPELADTVGAAVVDLPDGRVLMQAIGSRSFADAITLEPADVLYAPVWEQILAIANIAIVDYAGGSVSATDHDSVAAYGEYPVGVQTTLANVADAQTRANERVARGAYPRWSMRAAPLLVGYQAVRVGRAVNLSELPPAAPYSGWSPVLEGWQDEIRAADWTMALSLSDPLISGLTLTWESAPGTWATIDQTVPWRDAMTPGDLEP